MNSKSKTPAQQAFDNKSKSSVWLAGFFRKARQQETPVERELRRQRQLEKAERRKHSKLHYVLNILKTVATLTVWAWLTPFLMVAVTPYVNYWYAETTLFGMAICSAILVHVWPTRTPQWRTLFWMFWIIAGVGSTLLYLGAGTMSLTASVLAGFIFVLLRINENGRKLWTMIQDWRQLR